MVVTDNLVNGVDNRILRKQAEDLLYGNLTNWRRVFNENHRSAVLKGYNKINNFLIRGIILSSKKVGGK